MKKTLSLLLISIALNVGAAMHPSTDWASTNLMNKTNSSGVVAALGLTDPTNIIIVSSNLQIAIITTNYFPNTNIAYLSGAGSNIVDQIYYRVTENVPAGMTNNWTNAVNGMVLAHTASRLNLTNSVGASTEYYRMVAILFISAFTSAAGAQFQFTNSAGGIGANPGPVLIWATNIVYITNQTPAFSSEFPLNDFKTLETYVSLGGDDSTGLRGSRDFPFRTFNKAVTNIQDLDRIIFSSGTHYVSNAVCLKNISVTGAGMGITKISVPSAVSTDAGIASYGGGFISDITFEVTNKAAGNVQVGFSPQSGSHTFRNCEFIGTEDGQYLGQLHNSTNRFVDCGFGSGFDGFVTPTSATNFMVELINCKIIGQRGFMGSESGGTVVQGLVNRTGGGTVNVWGGSITATNGTNQCFAIKVDSGCSNIINLYNVAVTVGSTNPAATNKVVDNSGTAIINWYNCTINGVPTNTVPAPVYKNSFTPALGATFTNTTANQARLQLPVSFVASATGSSVLLVSNFTGALVWRASLPQAVASTVTNTLDLSGWAAGDIGACWDMSGSGSSVAVLPAKWVQ